MFLFNLTLNHKYISFLSVKKSSLNFRILLRLMTEGIIVNIKSFHLFNTVAYIQCQKDKR